VINCEYIGLRVYTHTHTHTHTQKAQACLPGRKLLLVTASAGDMV